MKKYWKSFTGFFAIILLIYFLLYLFSIKVSGIYNDGAGIICKQKRQLIRNRDFSYHSGKKNVLFIGNSKILAGLIPDLFDSLNHYKTFSYNCSLPALPVDPHYFLLKDYLQRNPPPDYIIIHLSINPGKEPGFFDYYALQGIHFPDELVSYFINRKNKAVVANFFFPMNLYSNFFVKYLYNKFNKNSDIPALITENNRNISEMVKNRGYFCIKEQAVFPDMRLPDNFQNILNKAMPLEQDPFIDPFVSKFFDLCLKKNIKVLIIQEYVRQNTFFQYSDEPEQFRKIKEKYPNVYSSRDGYLYKFYQNRFFSDPTHVNYQGARLYTIEISKEFNEAFTRAPQTSSVRQ